MTEKTAKCSARLGADGYGRTPLHYAASEAKVGSSKI